MENYLRPEETIRHAYPIATRGNGPMAAVRLCFHTLPILGLRLGILAGFTLATAVWFVLVTATASTWAQGSGAVGALALAVGLGLPATLFFWLKRYVLYLLEMAHIAVLTRLIMGQEVSGNQVAFGKAQVQAEFGQVHLLLVVDGLVQGAVNAFTATLSFMTSFLPIPEIESPLRILHKILKNATEYIGDTVFSYNLARGDENPWRSSKDGLVYYAQNWKPILKTAVYALVMEYVLTAIAFLLFAVTVWALSSEVPSLGWGAFALVLMLGLNVRAAVIRPVCLTMVMLTFHESVCGQEINSAWEQKLDGAAKQARELTQRARAWTQARRPAGHSVPVLANVPVQTSSIPG